jgi:hypothetical protein
MSILNELWAERLNEKKVQDDEYFIAFETKRGSKIDLYTEKAFKSVEAAERALEKFKDQALNDIDSGATEAELDELEDSFVISGKDLKIRHPKLFESKNHLGDREYTTYASWKAAIRKAAGDKKVEWIGDKDIGEAHVDGKSIGEWDGEVGSVYSKSVSESKLVTEALDRAWKKIGEEDGEKHYKHKTLGHEIKISKTYQAYAQSHGPAIRTNYQNLSYKKADSDRWVTWGEVKHGVNNYDIRRALELKESADETTEGLFVSKFKDGKLFEAKIPAWFKNGAKVRLTPEYADKDPNEVFTLKNVDEETGKGRIEDEDGRGWNIRASQVESARGKKKTVYEDAKLNALGAGLAGKKTAAKKPEGDEIPDEEEASTKPKSTVPPEDDAAPAEDDAPVDASAEEPKDETPAEKPVTDEKPEKVEPKASDLPDADAEENTSAPEFKVGDVVKPLIGPHKGEPHDVVGVNPDGTLNIKPKGLEASAVKYNKGGAKAKPDQVVIAESKAAGNTITYERVFNVLKNGEHQVVVWELHNGKRIVVAEILECKDKKKLEKMTKHYDTKKVVETLKPLKAGSLLAQIDEHLMPLSYRPKKGDTLEAYGRKGMKNTQWRKFFRNDAHLEKWCEENDATIEGMRELDRSERAQ